MLSIVYFFLKLVVEFWMSIHKTSLFFSLFYFIYSYSVNNTVPVKKLPQAIHEKLIRGPTFLAKKGVSRLLRTLKQTKSKPVKYVKDMSTYI